MDEILNKKIIEFLITNDILVLPEIVDEIKKENDPERIGEIIKKRISDKEYQAIIGKLNNLIKENKYSSPSNQNEMKKKIKKENKDVKVIFSYDKESRKINIQDFVQYLRRRYKKIESILSKRPELSSLLSIRRINEKKERDIVAFVGLVRDKQFTKNNNLILEIEDPTDSTKLIITNKNPELFESAKDVVLDEVIGVTGFSTADKVIFGKNIFFPDVPMNKEIKKSPDEAYAIFISDLHIGSKNFLEKDFMKFIKWVRGESGNPDQRRMASLVKYCFISGDLVDGVGIYPGQEDDLEIKDIYQQYEKCAYYLRMIPDRINLIICAGNHDAVRLSEPQPVFSRHFSKALYDLPNVTMVSNPGMVNIHASEDFSGFDVLMYHGYSMNYLVREVESLKLNGGYLRSDLIMKMMLTKRHLAPSHGSTLYIPDIEEDPLVINKVPDFFLAGDIHYSKVSNYKNVTLICGSCFQSSTDFQKKLGHTPEPGRVAVVDLQSRNVKILNFGE